MANSTLPKVTMAKLLQLSRPSRRVRDVVRTWWAMRRQKRRRAGRVQVLPIPNVWRGLAVWEGTAGGFWDVSFGWLIELGGYPEEGGFIQVERNVNGQGATLVGSVPVSDEGFCSVEVTEDDGIWVQHRARYWYDPGSGPVYGEWTPWLSVKCFFPPQPVLFLAGQVWDQTVPGYADVTLGWTFNHADLPAGLFDVQAAPGPNGTDWEDVGSVDSGEREFYHECAYSGQSGLTYRVRYRNDGVEGEWSAGFNVDFDD